MSGAERINPFPGPKPYREQERERFLGREECTRLLANNILMHPCVLLFGPSGSGKSSLMQAGVVPLLEVQYRFRTVRVDAWLKEEPPLEVLAKAMFSRFELGEVPAGMAPAEAIEEAIRWEKRSSERPVLLYLDQLEQLLFPDRKAEELGELVKCLELLAHKPVRGLQLVLALREDYLGRFRHRARGRKVLWEQGFRLGPLTVGEMVGVACQLAGMGVPKQTWEKDEVRRLILQVREKGQAETDEAEVQAAFAQIVCHALWEERAEKGSVAGPVDAEPIVHRYLEATLEGLGPLKADARRLLEEYLVASDGTRTLLMEEQARAVLPAGEAQKVLKSLEDAAVLRAEAHGGSRYFELGHDWLARKVLELRSKRLGEERALERERLKREEAARRRQRERASRRRLLLVTAVSSAGALLMGALLLWTLGLKRLVLDQALMAGAQEWVARDQPDTAISLLSEIKHPKKVRGWVELSNEALASNHLIGVLPAGELITAAAISPDGQHVVTASEDGTARVWRADGTGEPVVLEVHEGTVRSVAFSPDGQHVVTASSDGTARVWRADGMDVPVALTGHEAGVTSATFSPAGDRVVTTSSDGTARVWRADGTGVPVALKGHTKPLTSAAFSPDGQRVVTASMDGTARVWRADGTGMTVVLKGLAEQCTARPLQGTPRQEEPLQSAAFSPKGERVVTASFNGTVRVWRADGTGKPVVLCGHTESLTAVVFSPEGERVLTASFDGTVRVWRADGTGEPVVLKGHTKSLTAAAFSPKGERVVTASSDGTARVWRVDGTGEPVLWAGHEGPVRSVAFSSDGQRVMTASTDRTARVWQVDGTGEPVLLRGPEEPLVAVAFSPDGQRVATASLDGTARVWRADGTGEPVVLKGHEGPVMSVAFSPDGQHVVTASEDGTARVWRADGTGEPVVLKGHEAGVTSAAFSPKGERVVTTSSDGTARVWNADGTGTPVVLKEHEWAIEPTAFAGGGGKPLVFGRTKPLTAAAFSPNGERVVAASYDGTAWVWRADGSGEPVKLSGPTRGLQSVAFSPKGERVVAASLDGTAWVWRADGSGKPIELHAREADVSAAVFSPEGERKMAASGDGASEPRGWGNTKPPAAAVFSPDGKRVVTASLDGTVRVWRADGKGRPLTVWKWSTASLTAIAFSPDGARVLTGSVDGIARNWPVSIESIQQLLQEARTNCLSSELRHTYFDESEETARSRYEACERSHHRTPLPEEAS
ncbi:MAG TPA: hypothetical protein VFZ09_10335 [Archangium sp.]|uniref:nSTAND1 domain-containing NTPase n=1 Tax=Archangium sp. TaxID=1872627 RepID=UPI002E37662A|nr:hypothetical protein [Archangium sp.]HEX5746634.1 hypothetical protein [Archangium sp.]